MKTAMLFVVAGAAVVGILIYQFGFQKIRVPPGSVSRDELMKTCNSVPKDTSTTAAESDQMKIVCECMMDANATSLSKPDGTTMIDWLSDMQQKTTACMAKAGISTQ